MAKNWIAGAIKHPGALHKMLGVPQGQKIPASKLAAARKSSNPLMRRRAILAKTLSKFHGKGGMSDKGMMMSQKGMEKGMAYGKKAMDAGSTPGKGFGNIVSAMAKVKKPV